MSTCGVLSTRQPVIKVPAKEDHEEDRTGEHWTLIIVIIIIIVLISHLLDFQRTKMLEDDYSFSWLERDLLY